MTLILPQIINPPLFGKEPDPPSYLKHLQLQWWVNHQSSHSSMPTTAGSSR